MFDRVLAPAPRQYVPSSAVWTCPPAIRVACTGLADFATTAAWEELQTDLSRLLRRAVTLTDGDADIRLHAEFAAGRLRTLPPEGYALTVTPSGATLVAQDPAGLFYAVQTLLQLATLRHGTGTIPCAEIQDAPAYPRRWYMVDLGRAVHSAGLLRRIIRLCAKLKYNGLHLHLHDNELNPVQYDGLPLGAENPWALPLREYDALQVYARHYHVELIPELESWGHCGSLLTHYPQLYGATRLHGRGHSLGIGPASFDLLEQLYDQWLGILPDGGWLHLGLDEANWRLLPGADPAVYHRQSLVPLLVERARARARAHGKDVRLMVWGGGSKHADVFIPPTLRDELVVIPWHYYSAAGVREQLLRHWVRDTKRYSATGALRSPFLAGAGTTGAHEYGTLEATNAWALQSLEYPNCLGIEVMNWGSNDLHGRLLPLFHGAAAAWSPHHAERLLRRQQAVELNAEEGVGQVAAVMRAWQGLQPLADPDAIARDRGPEMLLGRYRWGERHGDYAVPQWMPEHPLLGDQP